MAAAAAYAGVHVRGSLREMEARLAPTTAPSAGAQAKALDKAGAALVPRILDELGRKQVAAETLTLARTLMARIAGAPWTSSRSQTDATDDALLSHDEAAAMILGLQDRETRDRAAEWMEGPDADSALRLWRALCRRCVAPYAEHATAPSPSRAGSRGPPGTSPVPASLSDSPCASTISTSSPASSTRPATRAWTRRPCATASVGSALHERSSRAPPTEKAGVSTRHLTSRRPPTLPGGAGARAPGRPEPRSAPGPAGPRRRPPRRRTPVRQQVSAARTVGATAGRTHGASHDSRWLPGMIEEAAPGLRLGV